MPPFAEVSFLECFRKHHDRKLRCSRYSPFPHAKVTGPDEVLKGRNLPLSVSSARLAQLKIGDLVGVDGAFDDGRASRLEPAQLTRGASEGRAFGGEEGERMPRQGTVGVDGREVDVVGQSDRWVKSVITSRVPAVLPISASALKSKSSVPAPPVLVSLPTPPVSTSLPLPPLRMSLPDMPSSLFAPVLPAMVLATALPVP